MEVKSDGKGERGVAGGGDREGVRETRRERFRRPARQVRMFGRMEG